VRGLARVPRQRHVHILIIGGEEIGFALAKALASHHELSVVDAQGRVSDRFGLLDVAFLTGSGTSPAVLEQAGVDQTDLLIACTGLVFFLFYILTFAMSATAVILLGADLATGVSATMATLGNVGPGIGMVGPMPDFGHLSPLSKLVLTATMWIGRLEVLTVLALLRLEVWRSAHWRVDPPRSPVGPA